MTTTEATVTFEEPPPRGGGRLIADPTEIANARKLAEKSGAWGLVGSFDNQHDALLMQRRISRGAAGSSWQRRNSGSFAPAVRKINDRQWNVYAKHVAENVADDAGAAT